jgi:hypothetical protein
MQQPRSRDRCPRRARNRPRARAVAGSRLPADVNIGCDAVLPREPADSSQAGQRKTAARELDQEWQCCLRQRENFPDRVRNELRRDGKDNGVRDAPQAVGGPSE